MPGLRPGGRGGRPSHLGGIFAIMSPRKPSHRSSARSASARVAELAAEIGRDHQGRSCCWWAPQGRLHLPERLARALPAPCRIDFVRLASYGASDQSSGGSSSSRPAPSIPPARRAGGGGHRGHPGSPWTGSCAGSRSRGPGGQDLRPVDKPERRQVPLSWNYVGFQIPGDFWWLRPGLCRTLPLAARIYEWFSPRTEKLGQRARLSRMWKSHPPRREAGATLAVASGP